MKPMATADEEAGLLVVYAREAECYGRALGVAETLPDVLRQGGDGSEQLRQVVAILDEVATLEASIADIRRHWQQTGRRPGGELQALLRRVTELIERLAVQIGAAEKEATTRRDRLIPDLDAGIRVRRMQRAYGGGM